MSGNDRTLQREQELAAKRVRIENKIQDTGWKSLTKPEERFAAYELCGFPCNCGNTRFFTITVQKG